MARDEAQVVELCQALGFEVLLKLVEAVDKNLPYYALDTQFFKNLKLRSNTPMWLVQLRLACSDRVGRILCSMVSLRIGFLCRISSICSINCGTR
jgi:hypothetical protein